MSNKKHNEKHEIFNNYFKKELNINFDGFLAAYGVPSKVRETVMNRIFTACDLVQQEQQKNIAEKVLINVKEPGIDEWTGTFFSHPEVQITVNKDSVLSSENLIK